ncbi:TolC family outer membrane protein [Methylocystis rosea]|uniref:Channel protein TolC n=1 Tax=Methylocystis rosea TaxID=173366 RepID=A0A3G8MAG6_9HYPH|nr:TolC family outer membrane protein [Methylocystis rosea]AZG78881.1 channel protein TolC [Methylocystis rosea]
MSARGSTLVFICILANSASCAETLTGAMRRAYGASPVLNASRAQLRAIDETVPQAQAGLRPRVSADAYIGAQRNRLITQQRDVYLDDPTKTDHSKSIQSGASAPRSAILSVEQPIFDGFRTQNQTRAAESGVFAGRERLRLTEQRVLFDAVSAYMNVLRDTAVLKLQENNVAVLAEQLRQTHERYLAGQITLTDISQAEARLAGGKSLASAARATLDASIGVYRRTIGVGPTKLAPGAPIDRRLPKTREEAERIALGEHPFILAALHDADAADLDIKALEAEFLPRLSIVGDIFTQTDFTGIGNRNIGARVGGRLNVPLYEGGVTSSRVRQAKETAGQRRLDADVARAEVLALVRANWGALQAAKTQIASAQTQIAAAERALYGVREEAKAGQRTTLDILNAQQELLNARIGLILAQRDRVIASYAVLAAIGRLSTRNLNLNATNYDPSLHFEQVKDLWGGAQTPSGR